MAKNNLITTAVVALIAGALGFYGGTLYQKSKGGSSFPRQFQNGLNRPTGLPGRTGFGGGSRPVNGEIVSLDDKTLTVKTPDGSSKIVIYSDSTNINKTSTGSKSDLEVGEQVMIIGTEGTDGTVTAQNISVGGNLMIRRQDGQPPNDQPPETTN